MVSADLMGITRDDLVYDVGRHVDGTVHLFEEWGLPIWKQKETEGVALKDGGKPVRSGKWQIMINGESYKPIVAEAAKKALGIENIYERVFIVKLLLDANEPNRIAGAVGFSVRENKIYVFKANAVLLRGRRRGERVPSRGPRAKAWAAPGIRCGTQARPTPWPPRPAPS